MGGGPYAQELGPLLIRSEGVVAKARVTPEEVVDLKGPHPAMPATTSRRQGGGPKTAITLLQRPTQPLMASTRPSDQQQGALKNKARKTDRENAYRSRCLSPRFPDDIHPSGRTAADARRRGWGRLGLRSRNSWSCSAWPGAGGL